jgi:hypothetical protein
MKLVAPAIPAPGKTLWLRVCLPPQSFISQLEGTAGTKPAKRHSAQTQRMEHYFMYDAHTYQPLVSALSQIMESDEAGMMPLDAINRDLVINEMLWTFGAQLICPEGLLNRRVHP